MLIEKVFLPEPGAIGAASIVKCCFEIDLAEDLIMLLFLSFSNTNLIQTATQNWMGCQGTGGEKTDTPRLHAHTKYMHFVFHVTF